MASWTK